MKHLILGTAGHVDHGKTELIKALTGVETDRLPQEKERGISIELGFAPLRFASELLVGIVDVPGHEGFIKTMVSGVYGIDIVMLCIAADEGIKPQTVEHINICNILGIKRGIVVLTKSDLVDEKTLKDVQAKAEEFLKGGVFERSRFKAVSSKTKDGVAGLKDLIKDEAGTLPQKRADGKFRMSIDRVFSIKGFGTVVTGTSLRGTVKEGDSVSICSGTEGQLEATIRGIETFAERLKEASGGLRLGLNLGSIDKDMIKRGDVLCKDKNIAKTISFDAWVEAVSGTQIRNMQNYKIHFGTKDETCSLKILSKSKVRAINEGESCFARITLKNEGFIEFRERFVIRSLSPSATVGGGVMLNPDPPRSIVDHREYLENLAVLRDGDASGTIFTFAKMARTKGLSSEDLTSLLDRAFLQSVSKSALEELKRDGKIVQLGPQEATLTTENLKVLQDQIKEKLTLFQKKNSLQGGMPISELRQIFSKIALWQVIDAALNIMIEGQSVKKENERLICLDENSLLSEHERKNIEKIMQILESNRLCPPKLKEMSFELKIIGGKLQDYFKLLIRRGLVVRVSSDYYCAKSIIKDLERSVLGVINRNGSISVTDFKELTGITRKYAIPLLEYLDSSKITLRREDNSRVKGASANE